MLECSVFRICLTKGYRSCIQKRCVKGSLFASVVRVLSMKIHSLLQIYKDVDAFIAPSEYLKKKLAANGFSEEKIHCIPTFAAQKKNIGEDLLIGSYGLYFGRITEEKGVDTLVHTYEMMPDHFLKIVGDDTTEEAVRLKAYIAERGIGNIEFLGFKSGRKLEKLVHNARFVVIPSIWYDNLPNTALEAFQQSKPVIASNIGSLPELVEDGCNGYLFTVGSAEELAEKIRLLDSDDRLLEMGSNSRRRFEEKFGVERHYEVLMEVFRFVTQVG